MELHITCLQEELDFLVCLLLYSLFDENLLSCKKVADVSEAVRQYADALMLSGESAIGPFGQKALSVLRMTSSRMELWSREENRHWLLHQSQLGAILADQIAEQICNCAVEMGTCSFPWKF